MRIILATHNRHKLDEMRDLFADPQCDWVSLDAYPHILLPEETGATFEANARLKAAAVVRATGEWALADDSGLCIDALDGAPGVYSARYAGEPSNAGSAALPPQVSGSLTPTARNIAKVVAALRDVPADRRQARFVAVLVLADPRGVMHIARGECYGEIIDQPRGTGGFGYDPIFWLPELGKTMAELTPAEKNQISHRARAAAQMKEMIAIQLKL